MRAECSFGITPTQTRPMIGQRWCEQALRTVNQARNLRFVPLHSITEEPYTVYWQVKPR